MNKKIICRTLFTAIFTVIFLGSATYSMGADMSKMKGVLNKKAAIFNKSIKKASRNLVNAAQDNTFKAYYNTKDESERKRLKAKIEEITLSVQKKFKVDEMCLIDEHGHEHSRIVFDKVAPDADLSTEEGSAPFFKPSFEQVKHKVHVEKPYLSADSLRWVIAYTTPIVQDDGRKSAILHYEMPLSDYQKAIHKDFEGKDQYIVALGKDGLLYADSRHMYKLEGDPGKDGEKRAKFFPPFDDGSSSQLKSILSDMKNGKSGDGNFKKDGKSYSVVYRPLAYFDWSLAVISSN